MAFGISGKIHGKDPNFRGEGGQAGCDKIPTLTENPFAGLPFYMAVGAHTVVYIQYCIETEAAPKGSKMQNRTKNSHTGACKCGKIPMKSRLFVLGERPPTPHSLYCQGRWWWSWRRWWTKRRSKRWTTKWRTRTSGQENHLFPNLGSHSTVRWIMYWRNANSPRRSLTLHTDRAIWTNNGLFREGLIKLWFIVYNLSYYGVT